MEWNAYAARREKGKISKKTLEKLCEVTDRIVGKYGKKTAVTKNTEACF